MQLVLKTSLKPSLGNFSWGLGQIVSVLLKGRYLCKSLRTVAGVESDQTGDFRGYQGSAMVNDRDRMCHMIWRQRQAEVL